PVSSIVSSPDIVFAAGSADVCPTRTCASPRPTGVIALVPSPTRTSGAVSDVSPVPPWVTVTFPVALASAAAIVADEAAVISPFALTVKIADDEALPNEPTFELTVLRVSGTVEPASAPSETSPPSTTAGMFSAELAEYQNPVPVTVEPVAAAHAGAPLTTVRTWPFDPTPESPVPPFVVGSTPPTAAAPPASESGPGIHCVPLQ